MKKSYVEHFCKKVKLKGNFKGNIAIRTLAKQHTFRCITLHNSLPSVKNPKYNNYCEKEDIIMGYDRNLGHIRLRFFLI